MSGAPGTPEGIEKTIACTPYGRHTFEKQTCDNCRKGLKGCDCAKKKFPATVQFQRES